jgi:hypothetical protein
MRAAIRRIPAPFMLAFVGAASLGVIGLVRTVLSWPDFTARDELPELGSVSIGSSLPVYVLAIVGLRWLSTGRSDRLALGARIAMGGFVLAMTSSLGWQTTWRLIYLDHRGQVETLAEVYGIAHLAATAAIVVGLALAARTRWAWALAPLVALVRHPELTLWLLHTEQALAIFELMQAISAVIGPLLLLVLVCAASRDYDPRRAVAAWPRTPRLARVVYARLAGIVLAQIAVYMHQRELAFAAAAVDLIVCSMLALDLLVAARDELPRWLAVSAAALALWVANIALFRGVQVYQGDRGVTFQSVPGSMYELAATCSLVCVLAAVALAARRRGLDMLRDTIVTRVVAVSVLALVGGWAISRAPTVPLFALIAIGSTLGAWLVGAHTLRTAAGQLAGGVMPTARVVR